MFEVQIKQNIGAEVQRSINGLPPANAEMLDKHILLMNIKSCTWSLILHKAAYTGMLGELWKRPATLFWGYLI